MSLPVITATGTIGYKDFKVTQNGKSLCRFKLNCSEKGRDGKYNKLSLQVVVFDKAADFVNQYFHDGDVVEVVGKIHTNVFAKDDGTKVYTVEFLFPQVNFPPKPFSKTQGDRQGRAQYGQYEHEDQKANGYQPKQRVQSEIDTYTEEIPF